MADVVVSVTEPDPPVVMPTVDPTAVALAEQANDTAHDAIETVTDVAESVEDNMSEISEQLTTISERLSKLETPEPPPETPDNPDPVTEPILSSNPNSPEGSVPTNDIPSDSSTVSNVGDTSGATSDDSDNDKPEQRNDDAPSSGSGTNERKRDRAPKQKLGWKAKILGGSGGRR